MDSVTAQILVLTLLLAGVVGVSLVVGLRDPLTVRIGLRNFLRGRSRTLILILGLLVGTTIISSSLVIGDTLGTLVTHFTYVTDGPTHEAIYAPGTNGLAFAPYPEAVFERLQQNLSALPHVQGVSPFLLGIGLLSGLDLTSGIPQGGMNLIGTEANSSSVLGDFQTTTGASLGGPGPGEALLDPTAALDLNATSGDTLVLHSLNLSSGAPTTVTVRVEAIVQATPRGGFMDNGEGDVFVPLSTAQSLLGLPGMINYIAVTNTGGLSGGIAETSTVWSELNQTVPKVLATLPPSAVPAGLTVHAVLRGDVAAAESSASSLTTLFLVVGLFSIVAGSVLIVGIFVLLAEERRGTMGVARAVGMKRGQLVRSYYFEGLAYSAGSALLGTFLGVGVALALLEIFASSLGVASASSGLTTQAILQSFTVSPASLLTAYVTGFLLTLGTITLTAFYVSRLNIVRAVRNLPEPPLPRSSYYRLGLLGGLLILFGVLLYHEGLQPGVDENVGLLGISLLILGAGLGASALVPNRYAFSGAGIALIAFWSDSKLHQSLFAGHPASTFVFLQEGVFLILGAILLYIFNSDLVTRAFSGLTRAAPRQIPVVRVALSYPGQKRVRTSMTLAIFAMVMFTIVTVASLGSGVEANLNNIVTSESGGYTLAAYSSAPIPNFYGAVRNNTTTAAEVTEAISFYSLPYPEQASANLTAHPSLGLPVNIAAAPAGLPAPEDFYTTNRYNFTATEDGMSPAQVWAELQSNPHAAVISETYAPSTFNFGPTSLALLLGQNLTISVPGHPRPLTVTVIGILNEEFLSVILLNPQAMTSTLGVNQTALFLVGTAPGVSIQDTVYHLKSLFLSQGLQVIDFSQALQSAFSFLFAFLELLVVFVALGLAVGIVAIGILALRSVVERKNEIGVLRAVGFRRNQILGAFLLEYSFLALLGIVIGLVLGLILAYNLSLVASGFFTFAPPWSELGAVVLVAYGLTLLATGIPALRASRLPPAEALRYTE
jgi:putative ABC transport system permease protein